MRENAEATPDVTHAMDGEGPFARAGRFPALIITSSLLIFGCALLGNSLFGRQEPVTALVDVVRIDLDRKATNPDAIILDKPLSVDAERKTLLSAEVVDQALGGTGETDQDRSSPVSPAAEGSARLKAAIRQHLRIDGTANESILELTLDPLASGIGDQATPVLNKIADHYAGLRNREREQQKEEVLSWADTRLADWQSTIQQLQADVARDMQVERSTDGLETDGRRLIAFLIGATRSAHDETMRGMFKATTVADEQQGNRSPDVLERDLSAFLRDLARLETISQTFALTSEQRQKTLSNLAEAEDQLLDFKHDLDDLISTGLLDSPAAKVILPASTPRLSPVVSWAVAVPAAAVLSIMAGFALALLASGRQSRGAVLVDMNATDADVLANPHWPPIPKDVPLPRTKRNKRWYR